MKKLEDEFQPSIRDAQHGDKELELRFTRGSGTHVERLDADELWRLLNVIEEFFIEASGY